MDDKRLQSQTNAATSVANQSILLPLADTFQDVVWTWSPDGTRLLYVNDAIVLLCGITAEELMSAPSRWEQAIHVDDVEIAKNSILSLRDGWSSDVEYRIMHGDGTVRWVSDRKTLNRDEQGKPLFVGGVARDITQFKQTEKLLEVQKEILEDVALRKDLGSVLKKLCLEIEKFVPDAVATVLLFDDDRTKLSVAAAPSVSSVLIEILDGLVPGEHSGSCGAAALTRQAVFVTDTEKSSYWETLQDVVQRFGIRACWSIPIFSSENVVLGTFGISSFAIRNPNQLDKHLLETAAHCASIAVQSHRAHKELWVAKEHAELGMRLKTELLNNVSHELRTPMTAILGFTGLLLQDCQNDRYPPEHLDHIRTIERNGKHLLELINNLLDVSRIESKNLEVERIPCSPCTIVKETVESLRTVADKKQLYLEVDCDKEMSGKFLSDPTRLRQLLLNLIGNAIKFTKQGGVKVRVWSEPAGNAMSLFFRVDDSGIGLEKDQIPRIFHPFRQADSSITREYGGSGLGLALCRQLAELLGGGITVESEPGRGSSFTLHVIAEHLSNAQLDGSDRTLRDESSQGQIPRLHGKFLVAEDCADSQRLIRLLLANAGATVVVAENGKQACDLALTAAAIGKPFEIILMDMQMPVMDGCTATRALRLRGYNLPIVALTAHSMPGDRDLYLEAGCDAYLSKPIDRMNLLNTLAELQSR